MTLLWLLCQLPRLPALRWPGAVGSRSSWPRWGQPAAPPGQAGGWSEPLLHLLLHLLTLSLAGGAAERQLGAAVCQLTGGSHSSWAGWLGHSMRSSPACGSAAAAAALVLAFIAACAAAHVAAALLLQRQGLSGAHPLQRRSLGAWQAAAWRSAQHGIELLLLALLACEWWRSCAVLVAAAAGGTPGSSTAALAKGAAGLALHWLPRPLVMRAAGHVASAAQPWLAWWRSGGATAPSPVMLAAGYVAAQLLLQERRAVPPATHGWAAAAASRGNPAGSSSKYQQQLGQRQHSFLTSALTSLLHFIAEAALLPLLPLLHTFRRWRSAAFATPNSRLLTATMAVAAAQTLLLLASRASFGTLPHTPPFAAAQLLLCTLAALLLLCSAPLY